MATKKAAKRNATKRVVAKKATPMKAAPKKAPSKKTVKKSPAKRAAEVTYTKRRDFGGPIESYISTLEGERRAIAEKLRTIVKRAAPGSEEMLKWGMPVYSKDGLLCYFRAFGGHVSFGFYDHRDALEDPEGLLEGTGKGAHIKLRYLDEVNPPRFEGWVRAVAAKNAGH